MCGRFTLTTPDYETLATALGVTPLAELAEMYRPRFNLPPTDPHWILRLRDGQRELAPARWGLVPHWAKSAVDAAKRINARAESLRDKNAFKAAFERRRCVVPADGFFEWVGTKGKRRPIWFRAPEGRLLHFAGLYESWTPPGGGSERMRTFTIITTQPNDVVSFAHDRMPAILDPAALDNWMDRGVNLDVAHALLKPAPRETVVALEVSSRVNDVSNDDPSCLEPAEQVEVGENLSLFGDDA